MKNMNDYKTWEGYWEPKVGELLEVVINNSYNPGLIGIYLGVYESPNLNTNAVCETLYRVYMQEAMREEVYPISCLNRA